MDDHNFIFLCPLDCNLWLEVWLIAWLTLLMLLSDNIMYSILATISWSHGKIFVITVQYLIYKLNLCLCLFSSLLTLDFILTVKSHSKFLELRVHDKVSVHLCETDCEYTFHSYFRFFVIFKLQSEYQSIIEYICRYNNLCITITLNKSHVMIEHHVVCLFNNIGHLFHFCYFII